MPIRPASYKVVNARFKRNGEELRRLAGMDQKPASVRPAYLDMTDEEIDARFWNYGKADKTRMKKEAARERLRIRVQKELEKERG
jgi:hypothetical protein